MEQKIEALRTEYADLQKKLENPAIYSDPSYPKLAKRQKYLEETITLYDKLQSLDKDYQAAQEMVDAGGDLAELAAIEVKEVEYKKQKISEELEEALTPKDPNNDRDVIIEIRAAAGGDEASLFANDLYRMYVRWAENNGYKTEHISESVNDTGGFKEVAFSVKGDEAYKMLKFEAGVHRVQRVPTTESQGRIHTSTITVAVMPEAE